MCAAPTQYRIIDGLNVRFAESDPRDDHALLLSPWPESLFAFDQMWDRLAEDTHLVAVDLPVFGHSERRDTLFAPRAMGEFVIKVADEFGRDASARVDDSVTDGNDEASLLGDADELLQRDRCSVQVPSQQHLGADGGSHRGARRSVAGRSTLVHWSEVDRGGHFAAWEQPALFADEVRGAFRSLR